MIGDLITSLINFQCLQPQSTLIGSYREMWSTNDDEALKILPSQTSP